MAAYTDYPFFSGYERAEGREFLTLLSGLDIGEWQWWLMALVACGIGGLWHWWIGAC